MFFMFLTNRALDISRDTSVLDLVGVFYFNTGRPKQALVLFEELLRKDPHHLDGITHFVSAGAG